MANTKTLIIDQIGQLAEPVLKEQQAELVDLQFVHEHGQWVLRFFLDKQGGITLDDCATISNRLSQMLDETDVIKQNYSLEVSSPGLDRPLKKESDYQRFLGERVDVSLFAPLNGRRHFKGTLQSIQAGIIVIQDELQMQHAVPLTDVAKAKLDPEIDI